MRQLFHSRIRDGSRKNMDAVQRTYGTLGQRIKKFQIVYFVAEKIDSKRIFGIRRKDVDDASSYAELSPHFGDLGVLISVNISISRISS